jgi:hypothetical protein
MTFLLFLKNAPFRPKQLGTYIHTYEDDRVPPLNKIMACKYFKSQAAE